jgi:cell division protein FtsB
MEGTQTIDWALISAYIIPSVVSIATLVFVYLKDRASIKNTNAGTTELSVESDRQDSKLSLEWAKEFKNRLKEVEDRNKASADKLEEQQKTINNLLTLKSEQDVRIMRLETEISALTRENASLKKRVKELEDENKKLKGVE